MQPHLLQRLSRMFLVLVIGAAVLWACVNIAYHRVEEAPPGTTVIRIGHWQLEAGVREAFEVVAADYQRIHPNVRIIQDAIPDQVFAQWTNTQLVGGTAPDLIEAGGLMAPSLWLNLQRRYLLPLTDYYARPNPYNQGTPLEGVPLTQTLRGGNTVVPELQENMDVSLSRVAVRLFYNKDLLKQFTGLEEAPEDLGAFIALCERIADQHCTPIVGSSYHFGMWKQLFDALTFAATRRADYNLDGYVGKDELYVAFQKGLLDFSFPPYRARFEMARELSRYFQPGFTGLTRDEGVLLFAQQHAVFMSTGLWEARGIADLAKGKFRVGVMKFPEPAKDDPHYGGFLEGPIYEDPRIVLGFAVPRTSQHPEAAVDFLLFMASQREDEKINQIIGWVPNVVGAQPNPDLAEFEPGLNGVYPAMDFSLNGETDIRWNQLMQLYTVNQITYDQLAADFSAFYKDRGAIGFREMEDDWQRSLQQSEQLAAELRAEALHPIPAAAANALWNKYCNFVSSKQVSDVVDHDLLIRYDEDRRPLPPPPAGYSASVLDKVRAHLQR